MQIHFQYSLVESNFVWLHSFANGFFPGSTVRLAKDYSWFHAQRWDSNLKHSIDVMYALGKANWATFYLVSRTIFFWLGLIACFSHNSLRLCVQVVAGWAWHILSARSWEEHSIPGWWFQPTPLKNDSARQLGWWHSQYPLVNVYITMENHHAING